MKDIERFIVHQKEDIRSAIKKMDAGGIGFIVIVNDDGRVVGIVSDGDFRRSILKMLRFINLFLPLLIVVLNI